MYYLTLLSSESPSIASLYLLVFRQKEARYRDNGPYRNESGARAFSTVVMSMPHLPVAAKRSLSNEKQVALETSEKPPYSKTDVESTTGTDTAVLRNERDIVTHIISVHDDPSLNPWTLRSFIIGIGLSAFGGILGGHHFCSREPQPLMSYNK